ncbi:serine/threonine-protein kinase [Streptomyces sp. GMR22]|uniref:serine/threonine-protein kinase n=1 Tax=Streptomyces sp. GMR22 TaxID=2759524 RepID=UPI0015F97824|nr:serine/threonine-protein kinase [Streptomyces sp. GMR22]MBA6439025.1 protein kinase [Streptomyces sp. GMR22]
MPETDPAHPWTGELTAADLERLGAQPLRRSDPVTIGPYRVLARLGGGGMGRLFLGRAVAADESQSAAYTARDLVAVKVIRPEYAEDARFRRRFDREVEAVRRVHGRYTAELLGSGLDEDEHLWMATAYVPGLSLEEAVRRHGPLPAAVVWRLAAEIGQALATIAAAGIVHRDLKPSNVLLGADGARVIDFGVVHTADASALTTTGQHVGTPAYMSPEQAGGRAVDAASDVFSLGSVLALAATGQAPFGEGSTGGVIHRVIYEPPSTEVVDRVAESAPELAGLIRRCLDKDPAARPSPEHVAEVAGRHGPAEEWPDPVAELIASRAGWSGRSAAVSPMDQLTVLRRGAPQRTVKQTEQRKSRRAMVLGAVAAVAAVVAVVVAFVVPGHEGSQEAHSKARVREASPTVSHTPTPTHRAKKHPTPSTSAPPPQTPPAAKPPSGGGGDTDPTHAAVMPKPQPTKVITVTPKPSDKPPKTRPWTSCHYYSGTALTKYRDKGDRVREVQCILKARGYNIGPYGVDGDFGDDTRLSVRDFQQAHHLRVDGIVGEDTWPALRGA